MTLVGKNKDGNGSAKTSKAPRLDNASTAFLLYLERLLEDLGEAEASLRHAIQNKDNPYSTNRTRLEDVQKNVGRLHSLVQKHLESDHYHETLSSEQGLERKGGSDVQ